MSVRYNERTGVWDFDSPEEAKRFREEEKRKRGRSKPKADLNQATHSNGNLTAALAAKVLPALWALAEAGPKGMKGEAISKVARLKGPKGMAGFGASVEKYLKVVTKRDDVAALFWKQQSPGVPAIWFVDAPKLEALGVLDHEELAGKK
jgi:hypothetical protein